VIIFVWGTSTEPGSWRDAHLHAAPRRNSRCASPFGGARSTIDGASVCTLYCTHVRKAMAEDADSRAANADEDMRREAADMGRMANAISEFLKRAHPKRYMQMVLDLNPEYLISKPIPDDGTGSKIKWMMQQGKLKLRVLPEDGLEIKLFAS